MEKALFATLWETDTKDEFKAELVWKVCIQKTIQSCKATEPQDHSPVGAFIFIFQHQMSVFLIVP